MYPMIDDQTSTKASRKPAKRPDFVRRDRHGADNMADMNAHNLGERIETFTDG